MFTNDMFTNGKKIANFVAPLNTPCQEMTTENQGFWRKTGANLIKTPQSKKKMGANIEGVKRFLK
ncbi:MAG: hypothetical protein V3R20_00705, partial [Sphingomonadales bacterium]